MKKSKQSKRYLGGYIGEDDDTAYVPPENDEGKPLLQKEVCFTTDGLVETITHAKHYLGDKAVHAGYVTIDAKMVIREGIKFKAFNKWWVQSIHDGTDYFHVQLPFFGKQEVVRVKFIADLKEQWSSGARWSKVKMEVDILNSTIVDRTSLFALTCDSFVDCKELLECV